MSPLAGVPSLAAVKEAAEHAAEGGAVNLDELIMHHLADGHEIDLPFFLGTVQLPTGWNVNLGPLGVVDFAPTKHVVFMLIAAALCLLTFIPLARKARRLEEGKAPAGLGGGMEAMILYFRDEIVRKNIGHGADPYVPYILTLFFFILFMNLLGLVPWGGSATGNVSVTIALALCTLFLVEISGMQALGFKGYLHTVFFVPDGMHPIAAAPITLLLAPVEFVGKLTKPFALTIRLFANMMAGHVLIFALGGLVVTMGTLTAATIAGGIGATALATFVMILEVVVAFLQAGIFALLTSVFVGLIRHAH
ncbi:MAG: ATP synthase F0 subunit A [Gemmatimonadetes bacterium]|nr:ATP synthase F0 subunit A [Gemmatimonadota bacterium]